MKRWLNRARIKAGDRWGGIELFSLPRGTPEEEEACREADYALTGLLWARDRNRGRNGEDRERLEEARRDYLRKSLASRNVDALKWCPQLPPGDPRFLQM
eukprot:jgi/Mesvir1/11642/Mv00043-RA.1